MRIGKGFSLFISNEDTNDIVKIIKSLEDSYWNSETWNKKNKKADFLELC